MVEKLRKGILSNIGSDLGAGLVVFFVAVPLCLGIALASGAPLFSGIVSGIVGGIVVGLLSKSQLSITGPAAGLAAIVLAAITELGAFNIFLCAGLIAGVIQLILGFVKAGSIANYFPSNVIEGMLAGIGIIIVIKQLPYAFGMNSAPADDDVLTLNTLSDLMGMVTPGAIVVTLAAVAIMLLWDKVDALKKLKALPGPLVAVVAGVVINGIFVATGSSLALSGNHLVSLPVAESADAFFAQFALPDINGFADTRVWLIGFTIAVVASIETLLSIEATDRIDPHKRYTPTNRELKAQGVGNILASLIGGLPMTSVVVRSSANVNAGGKTKVSAVFHGMLILFAAALVPFVLNMIPLAVLAAILILTGYKLAKPALFKKWWASGLYQFTPFMVTILGIVFTDLLKGVAFGMVVAVFFILRENLKTPYFFRSEEYMEGDIIHINLAQEVSFLNKAAIKLTLEALPEDSYVIIDASENVYMDHDVVELIREFKDVKAADRGIRVDLAGFDPNCGLDCQLVSGPQSHKVHETPQDIEVIEAHSIVVVKPNRSYGELIARFRSGKDAMEV